MNYKINLQIGSESVEGSMSIDGYEYEIEFEFNDLLFESKTFSQGEGSLKFKMFSGSSVYSLVLELEEEGAYFGEYREIERQSGLPEKVIVTEEVKLNTL